MKKTILYLFTLLVGVFTFSACEDPYAGQEIAEPTLYEQGVIQTADGFTFASGTPFASPVILAEADLTSDKVFEAIVTKATPALAEGATVKFIVEVSNTQDFTKKVELPAVNDKNIASVKATDLNEAVKTLYGKAPYVRDIYMQGRYYLADGSTMALAPTVLKYGPFKVTPVGPVIENEYYLVGDMIGWNLGSLDAASKFKHVGTDVYENPIFTILVNVQTAPAYWKIAPKSANDASNWDAVLGNTTEDGYTGLTGELAAKGGAMKIDQPGWAKITINMMEYTYTVELIGVMKLQLYVPGSHQGWSPGTAPIVYNRNFDMKYEGYVNFSANDLFKFTSDPDWDHTNYGDGGNGTLSTTGDNLTVAEAGYYKLNVDLSGSPFTYTKVKTDWGLIGDATVGGWDNSTPMTYNPDTKVWTVTTTLTAGKAFKFRANNGWDINLGGNQSNLSYGGDNIQVATDGTYLVTLDLSNPEAYKCSVVQQ